MPSSSAPTTLIRPLGVVLASSPNLHMWPLSRSDMPIQFVRDKNGISPFQHALLLIQKLSLSSSPIISLNAAHLDIVRDQCAEIEFANAPLQIVEPVFRGTLPSLATAALVAARRDRQAMMIVIDSHRPPENQQGFDHLAGQMRGAKEPQQRMVVGVQPQKAESLEPKINLHVGAKVGTNHMFEASGQHVPEHLNTLERNGIIFSTPRVMLQTLSIADRSSMDACSLALESSHQATNSIWPQMNIWSSLSVSELALALGNATDSIYLRPMDLGERQPPKQVHTSKDGTQMIELGSSLVVLQNCSDVDIVAHGDAALIRPKNSSNAIDQAIASLRELALPHLHASQRTTHIWGSEELIEDKPAYQIVRLSIDPQKTLPSHFHNQRSESWSVLSGSGHATFDGKVHPIKSGSVIALPRQSIHSLTNTGTVPLVVMESRHGDLLSRNDHIHTDFKRPIPMAQA